MTKLTSQSKSLKTIEQIRNEFAASGMSIASFARTNGFASNNVYEVLNCADPKRIKRGERFQIAVALGLIDGKPQPTRRVAGK